MDRGDRPERPAAVSAGAVRAAPYSYHAPCPPMIDIPAIDEGAVGRGRAPAAVDGGLLALVTRNAAQVARNRSCAWTYEQRREAQAILDFVYLGPTSVVRDHDFLRRDAITLIVVARDARMGRSGLLSVDKACQALGIDACYLDIDGPQGMISGFSRAVGVINDHLMAVHRAQAPRHAKVLVCCESGNDRSSAVVAAYIMAVLGGSMVQTVQFMGMQRFCCCFDEDTKRTLQTWEELLRARLSVASGPPVAAPRPKRDVEAMMAADGASVTDMERFENRDAFAPFRDIDGV